MGDNQEDPANVIPEFLSTINYALNLATAPAPNPGSHRVQSHPEKIYAAQVATIEPVSGDQAGLKTSPPHTLAAAAADHLSSQAKTAASVAPGVVEQSLVIEDGPLAAIMDERMTAAAHQASIRSLEIHRVQAAYTERELAAQLTRLNEERMLKTVHNWDRAGNEGASRIAGEAQSRMQQQNNEAK